LIIAYSGLSSGASEKRSLRSGTVVAATLNGYGSSTENKRARFSGQDIWWNYIISSEDQIYSVVSRENPAKTGLAANASLRFYEAKNWIYIPSPKGKPVALKILNKSKKK
jgi:hypothetical protein